MKNMSASFFRRPTLPRDSFRPARASLRLAGACVAIASLFSARSLSAADWKEILSQEQPVYKNSVATLTIGRDGLVYLCCSTSGHSFLLRMTREGKEKSYGDAGHMAANATADSKGLIATANAHAEHSVILWERSMELVGKVDKFLVNDKVGYNSPCHVETGASGDYYAADPSQDRILRIDSNGKIVKTHIIQREPGDKAMIEDFRVCEKNETFHVRFNSGPLRCIGFDGKLRWKFDAKIGTGWPRNNGAFDVDDEGVLYAIELRGSALKRVSAKGEPMEDIDLAISEECLPLGSDPGFTDLRVHGNDVLIKRMHDTEVFQRYDLQGGAFKQVVRTTRDD